MAHVLRRRERARHCVERNLARIRIAASCPEDGVAVGVLTTSRIIWSAACFVVLCSLTHSSVAQQWLSDANARIEQYRKASLTIDLLDQSGAAVSGAEIHVVMTRQSFGFGTAVPAVWITNTSPTAATFRQKLLENFNQTVLENDLKWPAWIGLWGTPFSWPRTEATLDWLNAHHLSTRGHYVSWATWSGSEAWGSSNDIATLPARLFDHISDELTTVGNRVFEWDVINHPVGWLNDTYENRVESAGLYTEGLDFYADIIDHARSVAPAGMPMWINEDSIIAGGYRADDYERIIHYLFESGSPPDGIGFQSHFIDEWGAVSSSTPEQVYERIDRFAKFGVPLRVTEFDIDVGTDAARQGQLMRDYLTVMFSHPSVEAVTLWGFWGGAHWRGENGALYRNDWTEKPSLLAYRDLVFNQWWTNQTGVVDELGQYQLRGFKGLYDIIVSHDGQQFVFSEICLDDDMSIRLILPTVPEPTTAWLACLFLTWLVARGRSAGLRSIHPE